VKKPGRKGIPERDNSEPLDIMRLRAKARALLENPSPGPAYIVFEWVGVIRDSNGALIGPNEDFRAAEIGDRVFERGSEETLDAFRTRVVGELPATQPIGSPIASFLSDDVCVNPEPGWKN
jgi:hypothetical protein